MSDTTEVSAALTLRRTSPEDLALLRHWDAQPHVVAAGAGDWGWETELFVDARWREQLIAELDGRPIGFVQVLDPAADPERYWGEVAPGLRAIDIWLGEATDLDRGLGSCSHASGDCALFLRSGREGHLDRSHRRERGGHIASIGGWVSARSGAACR